MSAGTTDTSAAEPVTDETASSTEHADQRGVPAAGTSGTEAIGRPADAEAVAKGGAGIEILPVEDGAADVEEPVDLDELGFTDRFLDRELSWLRFNSRVLELAEDTTLPLLNRVRFLTIFTSNLDEFFMVRVAGLRRRIAAGVAQRGVSGLLPRDLLNEILDEAEALMKRHADLFVDDIAPALAEEGIEVVRWDDLSRDEQKYCKKFFKDRVFPVLTPLAVDPAHPFPYISGLSLNLAVLVRHPKTKKEHFARVKVPSNVSRFVQVGDQRFVPMEDIIHEHLRRLFPGMEVLSAHFFRVTRNEDLEVEEDDAENLLKALEKELIRRRFGPPVRLEVAVDIDEHVLELLMAELDVTESEVYRLRGPLDLRGLGDIADLDRGDLKLPPFLPKTHRSLAEVESSSPVDIFGAVSRRDVLLHHPYDSFATSVQRFIEQAAADPNVLAIKQTLYRTSGDSPIIDALIDAAEAGKQVMALVEIKARFDESANIRWARKLEEAGCHVAYGQVGLKTHCKLAMVVRDEPEGIRRYTHIGTGNYNPKTARLYEDIGLLTTDPDIGEDVAHLFNNLSGFSRNYRYSQLLVAPDTVRTGIVSRIRREVAHHLEGRAARIRMKCNALVDEVIIDELYRASMAGVPVQLLVRGICCLRPGVEGLSENIEVHSVLGRFLEHSRVFAFDNGGDPDVLIGSADMMHRNLDRRVEVLTPLRTPELSSQATELLDVAFDADTSTWELDADGTWTRSAGQVDLQEWAMERARRRPKRRTR
ncbi:RNA degradosome polyphosphate kinase [Nocardioidaceae bacterium]|nr:RNA degradosome polyphosphate kinase [Nocardioidaceae bacterium]